MNTDLLAAARQIRAVRNSVTRRLVQKIRPWLFASAFPDPDDVDGELRIARTKTWMIDVPHAHFVPRGRFEVGRPVRTAGQGFMAFTRVGILSYDHITVPFTEFCVEDLIQVERVLDGILKRKRNGFISQAEGARDRAVRAAVVGVRVPCHAWTRRTRSEMGVPT